MTPMDSSPQPTAADIPEAGFQQPALDELYEEVLTHSPEDPAHPVRTRSLRERLGALIGHFGPDSSPPDGLADLTMLRVFSAEQDHELHPVDADALDAFVANGFDASRVSPALRTRAEALQTLGRRLVAADVSVPEGMADKILQRVQGFDQVAMEQAAPYRISFHRRLADIASIAAMLLIVVSIGWPTLAAWRSASMQAQCATHLRSVASAVGLYGGDFSDHLPAATAGFGGGRTWWNVGRGVEQSNSANLYTLRRTGYSTLEDLACPGNPHAVTSGRPDEASDWGALSEVSYSYRILTQGQVHRLGQQDRFIIATDRSPVVLRAIRSEPIYPRENSFNHAGSGQHVVFSDGSVLWTTSPVLESGDNFWLPRSIELMVHAAERLVRVQPIRGTEVPTDSSDDFVGP